MEVGRSPLPVIATSVPVTELPVLSMDPIDVNALPEMERFIVELKKDSCGLGITIAGYVCEKGMSIVAASMFMLLKVLG